MSIIVSIVVVVILFLSSSVIGCPTVSDWEVTPNPAAVGEEIEVSLAITVSTDPDDCQVVGDWEITTDEWSGYGSGDGTFSGRFKFNTPGKREWVFSGKWYDANCPEKTYTYFKGKKESDEFTVYGVSIDSIVPQYLAKGGGKSAVVTYTILPEDYTPTSVSMTAGNTTWTLTRITSGGTKTIDLIEGTDLPDADNYSVTIDVDDATSNEKSVTVWEIKLTGSLGAEYVCKADAIRSTNIIKTMTFEIIPEDFTPDSIRPIFYDRYGAEVTTGVPTVIFSQTDNSLQVVFDHSTIDKAYEVTLKAFKDEEDMETKDSKTFKYFDYHFVLYARAANFPGHAYMGFYLTEDFTVGDIYFAFSGLANNTAGFYPDGVSSPDISSYTIAKFVHINRSNFNSAATKVLIDIANPPFWRLYYNCVDWSATIAGSAGVSLPYYLNLFGYSSPYILAANMITWGESLGSN